MKTVVRLLGDCVEFQRGFDLPKTEMQGGDYPVLGSNGIIGYHNQYKIQGPVVVVGRSGSVGHPFMVEQNAWPHNTSLFIKDFKGNNRKYIYYLLKTLNLERFSSGSAVPTLNRNHIHSLNVRIHANAVDQGRIAAILSSFDDKIALNNKINDNFHQQK